MPPAAPGHSVKLAVRKGPRPSPPVRLAPKPSAEEGWSVASKAYASAAQCPAAPSPTSRRGQGQQIEALRGRLLPNMVGAWKAGKPCRGVGRHAGQPGCPSGWGDGGPELRAPHPRQWPVCRRMRWGACCSTYLRGGGQRCLCPNGSHLRAPLLWDQGDGNPPSHGGRPHSHGGHPPLWGRH